MVGWRHLISSSSSSQSFPSIDTKLVWDGSRRLIEAGERLAGAKVEKGAEVGRKRISGVVGGPSDE